jgi:hypothetical protein
LWAHENLVLHDQEEAGQWLEEAMKHAGIKDIKIEAGKVTGQTPGGPFAINLAMVTSAKIANLSGNWGVEWYEFPHVSDGPGRISWRPNHWSSGEPAHDAQRFQMALNFLASGEQKDWETKASARLEDFKLKAAAWRQQAVKPEMPEEAHRHQVLAENAFQSKDVGKAVLEYGQALQAFPYWPEGHYNLAMLAAEIGGKPGYLIAAHHMKEYLELVPDAQDARAVKDSIIIWEDKR